MRRTLVHVLMPLGLWAVFTMALAQGANDAVTEETRRVFEAYADGHDANHFAEDATFTDMTNPTQPLVGREAIAAFLHTFYAEAFSDVRATEVERLIEGNRVMLEFTFAGTHTGELFGMPATDKEVEFPMMSVYHIGDGLIRWARLYYDSAIFMQ